MHIPGISPNSAFPPNEKNMSGRFEQMHLYQRRQRRILLLRTVQFWWYPLALAVLGSVVAAILGQSALDAPKEIFGGIAASLLFFLAVWRLEIGLVVLTALVTPLIPTAIKFDSLYISPAEPLLLLLFFVALVQAGLRAKKLVLPSLWIIWPLIGLFFIACISEVLSQGTWLYGVSHTVLGSPIILDESVAIVVYCIPLITLFTVSACLTNKGQWIKYVQHADMAMAIIAACAIFVVFRRVNANLYQFRYSSPSIGWIPLEALAQLLALGSIIAYAHVLCTRSWRKKSLYAVVLALCLLALYLSLENSWWLETIVALAVITIVFSRRLFVFFCIAGLPLIPVAFSFFKKLQQVKSVDYYRLIIWQDMIRVWSKRPILGVGPGNVWVYDRVFSHLPQGLRNIDVSGLGVAHNGYLQTLAELGPLGLCFQVVFIILFFTAAVRLFRRSTVSEKLNDRILALSGVGLICGSAAGDFVAGYFFLPPRQALHLVSLPQALMAWVIYGCVIYKDQVWKLAQKGVRTVDE